MSTILTDSLVKNNESSDLSNFSTNSLNFSFMKLIVDPNSWQ